MALGNLQRWLGILALLAGSLALAEAAPLKLVYQRSGGFAGITQKIELDGHKLTAGGRGKAAHVRDLTPAEEKDLTAKLLKAQKSGPPQVVHQPGVADGFLVTLKLGDEAQPTVRAETLGFPAKGAGAAWDELLSTLDALLASELDARSAPKAAQ